MTVVQRSTMFIATVVVGLFSAAGIGSYQTNNVFNAANYTNVNMAPSALGLDKAFAALALLRMQAWQYIAITDKNRMADWEVKMSTSLQGMSQTTQQNVSSSEELAVTAEEMSDQADQLQQAVRSSGSKDLAHARRRARHFIKNCARHQPNAVLL